MPASRSLGAGRKVMGKYNFLKDQVIDFRPRRMGVFLNKNTNLNIPVTVAGVKFRNPFYVSSGPTTMTVEQLEKIEEYGWGGASLKLTIDPMPYIT